jgi:hypothetical protein
MKRSKKKQNVGGRPKKTGHGPLISVRAHPDFLSRLDAWRAEQPEPITRPQAMLRLVDRELERAHPAHPLIRILTPGSHQR